MNKRIIIAIVVTFIAVMLAGFAVHGAWLVDDYQALSNLYRSPADGEKYFPIMLLAHLFMAVGFVLLYQRYRVPGADWLKQGLSFGVVLILAVVLPMFLIYYAVQPMPTDLVIKQIIGDSVSYLIIGALLGFLFRK